MFCALSRIKKLQMLFRWMSEEIIILQFKQEDVFYNKSGRFGSSRGR